MIEVIALIARAGSRPQRSLQLRSASAIGSNGRGASLTGPILLGPQIFCIPRILRCTGAGLLVQTDPGTKASGGKRMSEADPAARQRTDTDRWLAEEYSYETERSVP